MTMRRLLFTLVVVAGCTKADAEQQPKPTAGAPAPGVAAPPPAPPPTPPVPPPPPPTTAANDLQVALTAVTLADDCGGSAPHSAPTLKAKKAKTAKSDAAYPDARMARRCEQTSMQLAITVANAARVTVKSVELFDESGQSLGTLSASKPTRWSVDRSVYETWDEVVPAGTTVNASYVLERPDWARIGDRWNRTYTLKAVLTIGGTDRDVQKDVLLSAPATLPPDVMT